MDYQTQWWLYNTQLGRRTLERMMPTGAIPIDTRRRMCDDRGHDSDRRTGVCCRCGATTTTKEK